MPNLDKLLIYLTKHCPSIRKTITFLPGYRCFGADPERVMKFMATSQGQQYLLGVPILSC